MFKKEAEDYANKNVPTVDFGYRSLDDVHYDVKQAYQQGAEFGYIKGNEQLTKAKEIIKEMLNILSKENIEGVYEITEEAAEFLNSEVE